MAKAEAQQQQQKVTISDAKVEQLQHELAIRISDMTEASAILEAVASDAERIGRVRKCTVGKRPQKQRSIGNEAQKCSVTKHAVRVSRAISSMEALLKGFRRQCREADSKIKQQQLQFDEQQKKLSQLDKALAVEREVSGKLRRQYTASVARNKQLEEKSQELQQALIESDLKLARPHRLWRGALTSSSMSRLKNHPLEISDLSGGDCRLHEKTLEVPRGVCKAAAASVNASPSLRGDSSRKYRRSPPPEPRLSAASRRGVTDSNLGEDLPPARNLSTETHPQPLPRCTLGCCNCCCPARNFDESSCARCLQTATATAAAAAAGAAVAAAASESCSGSLAGTSASSRESLTSELRRLSSLLRRAEVGRPSSAAPLLPGVGRGGCVSESGGKGALCVQRSLRGAAGQQASRLQKPYSNAGRSAAGDSTQQEGAQLLPCGMRGCLSAAARPSCCACAATSISTDAAVQAVTAAAAAAAALTSAAVGAEGTTCEARCCSPCVRSQEGGGAAALASPRRLKQSTAGNCARPHSDSSKLGSTAQATSPERRSSMEARRATALRRRALSTDASAPSSTAACTRDQRSPSAKREASGDSPLCPRCPETNPLFLGACSRSDGTRTRLPPLSPATQSLVRRCGGKRPQSCSSDSMSNASRSKREEARSAAAAAERILRAGSPPAPGCLHISADSAQFPGSLPLTLSPSPPSAAAAARGVRACGGQQASPSLMALQGLRSNEDETQSFSRSTPSVQGCCFGGRGDGNVFSPLGFGFSSRPFASSRAVTPSTAKNSCSSIFNNCRGISSEASLSLETARTGSQDVYGSNVYVR